MERLPCILVDINFDIVDILFILNKQRASAMAFESHTEINRLIDSHMSVTIDAL